MADKAEDPWAKQDPWGGSAGMAAPGGRGGGGGAPRPADALAGRYSDEWYPDRSMDITATGPDTIQVAWTGVDWQPSSGAISEGRLTIPELRKGVATLEGRDILWDNGNRWKRLDGSAPEAAAPPSRDDGYAKQDAWKQDATQTWKQDAWKQDAWKQETRTDWKQQDGGGAAKKDAWGGWGSANTASAARDAWGADGGEKPAEEDLEARRTMRQQRFKEFQDWHIRAGMLPGKSEAEVEADEERLFGAGPSGEGIDFGLYDMVPCRLTGPKAELLTSVSSFEELFEKFKDLIPEELMNNVRRCGYKHPTPVQKFAIPAALSGRDVMCCAQTGSGKTAAFLVPTLAGMLKHKQATGALLTPYSGPCKPDTVIMSPTRELCLQIYKEAEKFFHRTKYRVARVYGQEQVKVQLEAVAKGADLIVATPGRLWDFVDSKIVDLTEVQCLVVDEADKMVQMSADSFMRAVIQDYGMPSKDRRQTMMFSATFPEECQKMAADYLYEHIYIGVGTVGHAATTVTQRFVQVPPEDKYEKMIEFIDDFLDKREPGERLLVFTNSKLQAKGLDEKLFESNIDTGALHGDLRQDEREANLEKFRKGQIDVMIATDVASRGLDISGVSQVLNYDLPFSTDIYVQRIGRTGRIGHRGTATTFVAVGKDGQWHDSTYDQLEVLKKLPEILGENTPAWLAKKAEELSSNTWGGANAAAGATASGTGAAGSWSGYQQSQSTWNGSANPPAAAPASSAPRPGDDWLQPVQEAAPQQAATWGEQPAAADTWQPSAASSWGATAADQAAAQLDDPWGEGTSSAPVASSPPAAAADDYWLRPDAKQEHQSPPAAEQSPQQWGAPVGEAWGQQAAQEPQDAAWGQQAAQDAQPAADPWRQNQDLFHQPLVAPEPEGDAWGEAQS